MNNIKIENKDIKVKKTYTVIGGDDRMLGLIDELIKDGNIVYTYGLENIMKNECATLEEALEKSKNIITAIPISKDNKYINSPYSSTKIPIRDVIYNNDEKTKKIIITGNINEEVLNTNRYNIDSNAKVIDKINKNEIIDVLKKEEFAVLNAISTAEGAIETIINNTNMTIQGSKILVIGYGRIGKILSSKLQLLGSNITSTYLTEEEKAWIIVNSHKPLEFNLLQKELNINKYDVIVNTVPKIVLGDKELIKINKDILILDLASNPGGVDKKIANELNLKVIHSLRNTTGK